ncbi:heme peroxidase [Mycena albidolilacea]|uniref:Peroxidase n=1 Tax=Mycena albidolilacea TaxID=1033008 RepID=A0AAD7ABE0_9AGAR|nr:heme peroxidase [Mycena albidolilacea]
MRFLPFLPFLLQVQIGVAIVPFYPWFSPLWQYEESLYIGPYFNTAKLNRTDAGSAIAAEWVRVAYHDMANADVEAGIGGIDMSIAFELDRPENPGQGLKDALNDFRTIYTPTLNMADSIALGVVFGLVAAGGPLIPFRGGRIEARSAGPLGVPQPQESLESHTDAFRRQGLSTTEMIQLVACGHSLGGVRNPDFADMVPEDGTHKFFDSTQATFDNNVVTGYLDSTTENPLVVAQNATFRSDLRIFNSDGNKTMEALANADAFASTCATVMEKMINTVPGGVTLTEPIEPAQFTVARMLITALVANQTQISVTTRWLNPSSNNKVTIFWTDKLHPDNCTREICSATAKTVSEQPVEPASSAPTILATINPYRFHKFVFNISSTVVPDKFWFEVEDSAVGDEPFIGNNGGQGFTRLDNFDVFLDSVKTLEAATNDSLVFVVAVRKSNRPSKISIDYVDISADAAPEFNPKIDTNDFSPDPSIVPTFEYEFWTAPVPFLFSTYTLTVVRDGQRIVLDKDQLITDRVNIL